MPELNLSNEQLGKLQRAFENTPADVVRGQLAEDSQTLFAAGKKKSTTKTKTKPKAKAKAKARPKAKSKSQIV